MKKYAYVQINGGLGKNLAFTQLTKEIKEKYDFLAVTSPYTDIFECCPYVDYVYKPNEMKDFISDAKFNNGEIFIDRIYDSSDFIYKRISYADAYRQMMHLKPKENKNGSDTTIELNPIKKFPQTQNQINEIIKAITKHCFTYKELKPVNIKKSNSDIHRILEKVYGVNILKAKYAKE